jgi:hypothetical protein
MFEISLFPHCSPPSYEYRFQDAILAKATPKERSTVAKSACVAAIGLLKWDVILTYAEHLEDTDNDKPFFYTLTSIYKNKFEDAQIHLKTARSMVASYFPSLLGEAGTYSRSYDYMVKFQV